MFGVVVAGGSGGGDDAIKALLGDTCYSAVSGETELLSIFCTRKTVFFFFPVVRAKYFEKNPVSPPYFLALLFSLNYLHSRF